MSTKNYGQIHWYQMAEKMTVAPNRGCILAPSPLWPGISSLALSYSRQLITRQQRVP
ncbi:MULTISPECIES: hypothetical protein [Prochlorococcus]|uniref:hypothetical protein n=1 Tax=Prochlorococcus TaxID=1218 RepID=UPI001F3BE0F7|nr:hypothetical protein [Prochlorococcus marinus]